MASSLCITNLLCRTLHAELLVMLHPGNNHGSSQQDQHQTVHEWRHATSPPQHPPQPGLAAATGQRPLQQQTATDGIHCLPDWQPQSASPRHESEPADHLTSQWKVKRPKVCHTPHHGQQTSPLGQSHAAAPAAAGEAQEAAQQHRLSSGRCVESRNTRTESHEQNAMGSPADSRPGPHQLPGGGRHDGRHEGRGHHRYCHGAPSATAAHADHRPRASGVIDLVSQGDYLGRQHGMAGPRTDQPAGQLPTLESYLLAAGLASVPSPDHQAHRRAAGPTTSPSILDLATTPHSPTMPPSMPAPRPEQEPDLGVIPSSQDSPTASLGTDVNADRHDMLLASRARVPLAPLSTVSVANSSKCSCMCLQSLKLGILMRYVTISRMHN